MFPRRSLRSTARAPVHSAQIESASQPPLLQAITQTLSYIDAHLDDPLACSSLTLASHANLPERHFEGLFHLCMGKTPQAYLAERRLEMGALLLAEPDNIPILKIARALGFSGASAFSDAFKAYFGDTPSRWRSQQTPEKTAQLAALKTRQPSLPSPGETPLPVSLQHFAPSRVAYLRHIGPYGPGLGQFWRDTVLPWIDQQGYQAACCFGIAHDNPSLTPAADCRYDAAIEIGDTDPLPAPAGSARLPGGRYAVLEFTGDPRGLAEAWRNFFQVWLPHSAYLPDARPCFERYPPGTFTLADRSAFRCQLCMPVKSP